MARTTRKRPPAAAGQLDPLPAPAADTQPIHRASGWDDGQLTHARSKYLAQRTRQRDQALGHLLMAAESFPPGEDVPGHWVTEAVNILLSGPGATRAELTLGRSI